MARSVRAIFCLACIGIVGMAYYYYVTAIVPKKKRKSSLKEITKENEDNVVETRNNEEECISGSIVCQEENEISKDTPLENVHDKIEQAQTKPAVYDSPHGSPSNAEQTEIPIVSNVTNQDDTARDQTISTSSSTDDTYEFEDQVEVLDETIEEGGSVKREDTIPCIDDNESGTISKVNKQKKESNKKEGCEGSNDMDEESILVSGSITVGADSVDSCERNINNDSVEDNSQEFTQRAKEDNAKRVLNRVLNPLIKKTADTYKLTTEKVTDSLNNPVSDEDSKPVSCVVTAEDKPEAGYIGDNGNGVEYSPEISSIFHDEETEENYSVLNDRTDTDNLGQENIQSFRDNTNTVECNSNNSGDVVSISGSIAIDDESDVGYKEYEQNVITDSSRIPSEIQEQQMESDYSMLGEIDTANELPEPTNLQKDEDESSTSSEGTPINTTDDATKDDNEYADSSNSSSSTSVRTPTTKAVTSTFGVWDVKPIINSTEEDLVSSEKDDNPVEEKKEKKRNRKRNKALRPQSSEKEDV